MNFTFHEFFNVQVVLDKSDLEQVSHFPAFSQYVIFGMTHFPFCFHSWKCVCCLRAASLIMHLTRIWIKRWPWGCDAPCADLFPSVWEQGPTFSVSHFVIWKHHCPVLAFYFMRRMSALLHSRHMEITFGTGLTVKSNGFALFLRWNWCQYAKLVCLLCSFCNIHT